MNNLILLLKERVAALDVSTVIQLILIGVSLFFLYRFLRVRRAFPIAIGIMLVYVVYLLSGIFELKFIYKILHSFAKYGTLLLVIVFAAELRTVFERIGNLVMPFRFTPQSKKNADEIIEAINSLSKTGTGALLFIERRTKLESLAEHAEYLDARITNGLILNIFTGAGPLHDGGILIRNGRIYAAACKVSMDSTLKLPASYGARHQAAVNLSAYCDAAVIVVSEEDRTVSIAERGELRHIPNENLSAEVYALMNVRGFTTAHKSSDNSEIVY